jgi:nitrite reductase/ring-hydroxylating ferredoxin subunit
MRNKKNNYKVILKTKKNIIARRDFLKNTGNFVGAGLTTSLLTKLISACSNDSGNPLPPLTAKYEIVIEDYPTLLISDSVIRCHAKRINNRSVFIPIIVRTLPENKFIIIQSNCTHQKDQNLPIHLNSNNNIVCPRHHLEFSLNPENAGKIVANPNNIEAKPLKVYEYEFKKNENKIVLLNK